MKNKYFYKLLRLFFRYGFPNQFRISCLRRLGVTIGNDVFINEGLSITCSQGNEKNLLIGDRVAIAPNVILILDSNPNNSRLTINIKKYPFIQHIGKIKICHDAWIGAGAIILPDITIGEFAIVGAGSVVTKSVEKKTVVAGNPAKPIQVLDLS